MRTRRIVFVAPFGTQPKGTTRARILPLARALAARGHTVTVLIPPYDHPPEAGRQWRTGQAAVYCLSLPPGAAAAGIRSGPGLALLSLRLASAALACRPDIIHLSKPKGVSGLAHWLLRYYRAARCRQLPALVVDADDWEGHEGWNQYEDAYPGWQKEVFDRQERWGLQHADGRDSRQPQPAGAHGCARLTGEPSSLSAQWLVFNGLPRTGSEPPVAPSVRG